MGLKFQFHKPALQQLQKQLNIRLNALPTLQAKEAALRMEVKNAKKELLKAEEEYQQEQKKLEAVNRLWPEFQSGILKSVYISLNSRKIAGIKTPVLANVSFEIQPFSLFSSPPWLPSGLILLKTCKEMQIKIEVAQKKVTILEYARKKTTQKVNLYEKVQIPDYQNAIRKINRFLEDEDNLAKSSQKLLKARILKAEEMA
jgi:V/A-type H+-transporting ATPase subunit D